MARRGSGPRVDSFPNASFAVDEYFDEDVNAFTDLRLFEDRRLFHPEGPYRPARSYAYRDGQLVDQSDTRVGRTEAPLFSGHVGFERPDRVFICARRKRRREVLMAKGRGGGGHRRPRRNYYSDVRC